MHQLRVTSYFYCTRYKLLFVAWVRSYCLLHELRVTFYIQLLWFKSDKLSLNVDKTKWSLFHPVSKRQFLPQTLPNLVIEDIHIKREHVTKFLGVFIDENLSWKQHIEILSSEISKSVGILYKSRDVLSKQCLNQLYFSFIHSYVNYANIAWASTTKSKLERLYRFQKHAARVIYHKDRYTHGSALLNDMKALNVFKLNIFNILCFMYAKFKSSCIS